MVLTSQTFLFYLCRPLIRFAKPYDSFEIDTSDMLDGDLPSPLLVFGA
jgi:hypothetical protein